MIPILDRVGKAAFMFYMVYVLVAFFLAAAYRAAGVEPMAIITAHSNLPKVDASTTLGNQTFDVAAKYIETSQSVLMSSLQAISQAISYIVQVVTGLGPFFASIAHALFDGTPLHGPMVAFATTAGYALQALAWIWAISNLAGALFRG